MSQSSTAKFKVPEIHEAKETYTATIVVRHRPLFEPSERRSWIAHS